MHVIEVGLAFILILVVGYVAVVWVVYPIKLLLVNGYRYMRWERHGLCYSCHRPLVIQTSVVDQMYNPSDRKQRLSCQCGKTTGIQPGSRRFAEW